MNALCSLPLKNPTHHSFSNARSTLPIRFFHHLTTRSFILSSIVLLTLIPSTTKAFVAGARNPFRLHSKATMAFLSSKHDSATAFSAASKRLESPSAERNKDPIWGVLSTKVIPNLSNDKPWTILETAAGAGVHTEYFASKLLQEKSAFVWHGTDPTEESLQSIAARVAEHSGLDAVVALPKKLTLGASGVDKDASCSDPLPDDSLDILLSINMIHISPWEATLGLMKVAGERLREPSDASDGGYLYCYGPYKQEGIIVPSNE